MRGEMRKTKTQNRIMTWAKEQIQGRTRIMLMEMTIE